MIKLMNLLEDVRKYVDNPKNRKLQRVGQAYGSKGDEASREQHSKASKSLSNRKGVDYHQTKNGGHVIGVEHGQDVGKEVDSIKKSYPKDAKIMFVGEGGMSKNNEGKIDLAGEQEQFRDGILGHFPNAQESSWDENADVYDNNSPVYKYMEKQGNLSQPQSMAAMWSNMVGQDREESDMSAEDYLSDEGVNWLKGEAKKANMKFSDNFPTQIEAEDYDTLYKLNYGPTDNDGTPETAVSKAQDHYNGFRQQELDRKIKEAEDDGFTVVAPVGNDHVDMYRGRNK
tara:strand:- start:28 stop:882 length:855 start_codon:yes stop_codon:yes gene_type:complete